MIEKCLNKLTADWEYVQEIVPYGCGLEAYRTLKRIVKDFKVPYIIDKDEKKQGTTFYGIPVEGLENLNEIKGNRKVVITIAKRRYKEIKLLLESYGLVEYQDFCHISQFGVEWYYKYKKEYCIFTMDIAVTTACTLKCEKCNMFTTHYKKPVMYNFEEIRTSLDLLFERIDYIYAIGILGGEALLNRDLEKILAYLYENYRNRYGSILITTNGVVMPNESIMQYLKKYEILVTISDYKAAIADRSKLDAIYGELRKRDIVCQIRRDLVWCDFGFPENPVAVSSEDARKHMLECDPGWRGLNDGKFFFCNVAWSADKAGLFQLNDKDYIDLKELEPGTVETKEKIINYSLGNMENRSMSFCRVCGGCGEDNPNYVEAGQQKC